MAEGFVMAVYWTVYLPNMNNGKLISGSNDFIAYGEFLQANELT